MTDLPDEETITARRSRSAGEATVAASGDTASGESMADDATIDGSTIVARRESRRRAAREQPGRHGAQVPASDRVPPDAQVPAVAGRVAAAPDATAAVYGARSPQPVIASRAAPPARIAQSPVDGDTALAAQRRTARRRALIVLISASALVLAAAASLLFVVFAP